MRKAVQHIHPPAQLLNSETVVLLVEEKAGFLSVFYIDVVADAIFRNRDAGVKFLPDKSFAPLHAFLEALFGIAALVDAADRDTVPQQNLLQDGHEFLLQAVDPKREGFHDQHVFIFVDRKPRQEIRFAKDDPAAGCVHSPLPVFPRSHEALPEKCLVNSLIRITCQHPHTDH